MEATAGQQGVLRQVKQGVLWEAGAASEQLLHGCGSLSQPLLQCLARQARDHGVAPGLWPCAGVYGQIGVRPMLVLWYSCLIQLSMDLKLNNGEAKVDDLDLCSKPRADLSDSGYNGPDSGHRFWTLGTMPACLHHSVAPDLCSNMFG